MSGKRTIRSGVYQWINKINNKSYIGSSKDITARKNNWFYTFKKEIKYRHLLKMAVQKYGIENFTFKILEECEPTKEALVALEQHYIDHSPLGNKWTEDSRQKLKEMPSPTRFSKERHSSFHKGSHHTEESKQKMREGYFKAREKAIEKRGYYMSEEGKQSMKEKLLESLTPERRAKFREETKEALKIAHKKQQDIADQNAKKMLDIILELQSKGLNLREIAKQLNDDGYRTSRGCLYIDNTIRQILKRTKQHKPIRKNEAGIKAAKDFAKKHLPIIQELQKEGLSLGEIADRMNEAGYRTSRGCLWIDNTVRTILKRLTKPKARDVSSEIIKHTRVIGWDK